jgi:hypothetical protein
MKRPVNILADSDKSLDDFVKEVRSVLGFDFQRVIDQDRIYYKFCSPNVCVYVEKNDYENDGEINFQDYVYDIEVEVFDIHDLKERERHAKEMGWFIFEKLRESQGYRLMLVDNLQVKLAEFTPDRG